MLVHDAPQAILGTAVAAMEVPHSVGAIGRTQPRIYWDGEPESAVDLSLGEFFCNARNELALLDSEMIVVAPAGGLNSYWPMPFRGGARMIIGRWLSHA